MVNTERLNWDTNFFGHEVYKIELQDVVPVESILSQLPQGSIAYVFCPVNIDLGIKYLVDTKTVLSMSLLDFNELNAPENLDFRCRDLRGGSSRYLSELYDLSIQSSVDSRFRKNNLFDESKVDKMYRLWIDKAIVSESHFIFGHFNQIKVGSLCVVRLIDGAAWIELFAVDKLYRGKGFGLELLSFVATECKKIGINVLKVTTQFDNISAMRLYQKFGFSIESQTRIFHLKKL